MSQRSKDTDPSAVVPADGAAASEQAQLAHALESRFAPHIEAALSAVKDAERELSEARERLNAAEQASDAGAYQSEPLVFMRASVEEEVEALDRKTNPKKMRISYRFLLDRSVELAEAENQGFHQSQAAFRYEREEGIQACREAEQRAVQKLAAAREAQDRVHAAEQSARRGLAIMLEKFAAS